MKVRINGAWRTVSSGKVRVGTSWKTLTRAKAYIGGAWKTVATFIPSISASVNPSTAYGDGRGAIYTTSVTVTPSGGSAPYTYAWTRVEGTTGTATNAGAATTNFYGNTLSSAFATMRCTVTSADGQTATADVLASFYYTPSDYSLSEIGSLS